MKYILFLTLFFFFLNKSVAQTGDVMQLNLIGSFYQTSVDVDTAFQMCYKARKEGNCVTIALVKAALGTFTTLNNIYKDFKIKGDSFFLKFNDNVSVAISKTEIDIVKNVSGIKPEVGTVYYDSAMIIYTSICKRIYLNKVKYPDTKCIFSFRNAVDYIDCGYGTDSAPELLGFKMESVKISNLYSEPSTIIWCKAHAAYCSFGFQDNQGDKHFVSRILKWMKTPIGLGEPIIGAYRLTKLNH